MTGKMIRGRQAGAAKDVAAAQDRGAVPGLSQYFAGMESNLGRMLQAADACLGAPQFCSVPSISCSPLPARHRGSPGSLPPK